MSNKVLNKVMAEIYENDQGRFALKITQSKESGRAITSGSATSYETHEEAVEAGTRYIKRALMPAVVYSDEPDDLADAS